MASPSGTSAPSIRTFQMDASSVGVLKNSVNLFRGDVNYTQDLFSLPGRSNNDGLQIQLTMQYQSNVNQQAMTWNRDQPTGVLGMGWTLPLAQIRMDDGNCPTPGQRNYTLSVSGNASAIVFDPTAPPLFSMDPTLASQLQGGQAVPAAIRNEFVSRGLPLSATAVVVVDGNDAWTLQDDALEQEFALSLGDALVAADGGEAYQLASYRFWKVLYYPRYERWCVTNDSGQRMSFGGGVAATDAGYATSAGNSIEWGVQWTDANGRALWQGNSSLAQGQRQFARAWHLQRVYSIFGESVTYAYNCFERNAAGLLDQVEQLVAEGGKPYTKACYLGLINDVFGRSVVFNYGQKLWSDATPSSPREYDDPHKAVPNTDPNGFQDCYETLYLASIDVLQPSGAPLFAVEFEYQPLPGSPVANVAGTSGDTCKRLLTSMTLSNADGDSLPGYRYGYVLDGGSDGNLGALNRIVWPSGGSASYEYTQQALAICDRTLPAGPPPQMPNGSNARVWFGPDYAVVLWCNDGQGSLSMQVYTWNGQWTVWPPEGNSPLLLDGSQGQTTSNRLSVQASQDFIAVSYLTSTTTDLHLFRQDMASPGRWIAASGGQGSGGLNSPTWSWNNSNGSVQILAGDSFAFAVQSNSAKQTCDTVRFSWYWPGQNWNYQQQSGLSYRWFASGHDHVASVDIGANVNLDWLDASGQWHSATPLALGFSISSIDSIALAGDASLLAISHLLVAGTNRNNYDLWLVQWNDQYQFAQPATKFSCTDNFSAQHPTSWAPTTVANSMVCVAANVARFDGASWSINSAMVPVGTTNAEQRYGYGPDYVVQVLVQSNGMPSAQVLGYDPTADAFGAPASVGGLSIPNSHAATANWVGAGSPDYLAIGTQLFFRGVATDWGDAVATSIADLQTLIDTAAPGQGPYVLNSASLLNQGPTFIACSLYDQGVPGGTASATSAFVLRNGAVFGGAQVLGEQAMWTAQQQGEGAGTWPGGPMAFFTYPGSAGSLDAATSVNLNRYAGNGILGPIQDWPVGSIALDDGLSESSTTAYVFDASSAACDATGSIVKYYQSTVYPDGDAADSANGCVVSRYLNGNQIVTGDDWYGMLDGLLYSVTALDASGSEVGSITNQWTAYVQRAGDPTDPGVPVRTLYGAYVVQTAQQKLADGVASSRTTSYVPAGLSAPYSGQPVSVQSSVVDGSGNSEVDTIDYRYACDAYAVSCTLNDLTSKIEQRTTQAGVTTSVSAMALSTWPTLWDGVSTLAEAADFGWTAGSDAFPFADWTPGQIPAGWQSLSLIQTRAADGTVLQNADGAGVTSATTYSADGGGLPIAVFRGAVAGECAWCGFQTYESTDGWQLSGTQADPQQAWLGEQSLSLAVAGSVSTTVTPSAGRTAYRFALRYLTAPGYDGGSGAITVTAGATSSSFDLPDTQGEWSYLSDIVALPQGCDSVGLAIANPGNGAVLLDGVLLIPVGCDITVQSWQASTRLLLASMNLAGACDFIRYDRFAQTLGAVGADGQWQELDLRFLSRLGNAEDVFDDASPNCELTLQFAQGGNTETFRNGNDWQTRWAPSDAADWQCSNGTLLKQNTTPATLTWQGGNQPDSVAFFIELKPLAAPAGTLALQFGGGERIAWSAAAGWTWTLADGSAGPAPLASAPGLGRQWLLLLGGGQSLFFVDGQVVFSAAAATTPAQGFAFDTGPNALRISQLGFGADPRTLLTYNDGAARLRQTQQRNGGDSLVAASVYDGLDRLLAGTKAAPGSFGSGAQAPMLTYRPAFLDVAAFLAATSDSWLMQGDVADYYAGQSDNGGTRSNDQGYPYYGSRYETAASSRAVEGGQPGLQLAIHDLLSIPESQRQTIRTAYGASTAADPVPPGSFYATTSLSPGGYSARQLVDTSQRATAMVQSGQSGQQAGQSLALPGYADAGAAATTISLQLPNAFTTAPQSDPSAYVRTTVVDPLGQVASYQDSDTGQTQVLYNGKGQLRFVQPALDSGQQYLLYRRYDALGRVLEEGVLEAAWDPAALSPYLDDPAWPAAADGAVPGRVYRYDGDGSDPNALGQLVETTTYNPDPGDGLGACTVVESWSYDGLGRAITARLQIDGAASQDATVGFAYNNLNEVVRIDLPDGAPLPAIVYVYDDLGRIVSIGTPDAPDAIARYTWTANGQLQTAVRGALSELWNYDSPGCVTLHQASVGGAVAFAQSFSYTPDRLVQQRTTQLATAIATGTRQTNYVYDGQQRLATATVVSGDTGNLSIDSIDANGNIWASTADGVTLSTPCTPGNNRLAAATFGSGPAAAFQYHADGAPSQWRGLDIGYDPCLFSTATVASPGFDTIRYARGMNNHCALRQQGATRQICFYGAGSAPLMVWNGDALQVCVWGPGGLVAVHDGALRYPVNDYQQSVWAVFDAAGNAQHAFDYAPFGAVLSSASSAASEWNLLFAGKRYDSDSGLYDFGARLYDPSLMRFLAPDAARQFASPYLFASDNPLNYVDPTGNISLWAQVGIGVAMVAVAVGGLALSVVTDGAAAPEAIDAEIDLAGAGGATDVAAGAGADAVDASVPLKTATAVARNALSVVVNSASSAISGAGMQGLEYDAMHGRDFTAKGFFSAMGVGALSGAVTGGFNGLASMPAAMGDAAAWGTAKTIAFRTLTRAATGFVGSAVSEVITDAVTGKKITASDVLLSAAEGMVEGAAVSMYNGFTSLSPANSAITSESSRLVKASNSWNNLLQSAQKLATTQEAVVGYIAGGWLLASGYAVWGVATATKGRGQSGGG
ncbi:RHS repeat domain-containing protein [Lysobacter antibioticus]|uniref:RHS repeat domain-containing protein n=1 Tax=Lysobacter antibioticus TaxID=84531 RepID=UPI000A6341EA|nr:RHS repeat-associated core domain-containing protein [Lysobacter antibioticus]